MKLKLFKSDGSSEVVETTKIKYASKKGVMTVTTDSKTIKGVIIVVPAGDSVQVGKVEEAEDDDD